MQSYATKSAIEVIEGKVFVPTRDIQLLTDLTFNQDQIAQVTQPAATVEPSTTPEPSNTPVVATISATPTDTPTTEPSSTPEPSRTPTLAPTDTPEPDEEPTQVVDVIETEGSVADAENDDSSNNNNNNEDVPVTTPVVIIAQTAVPTPTPIVNFAQPTATPNWVATQTANNNNNNNSVAQPTATPNWVATQTANNNNNSFAQPTATPNWVATQMANNNNNVNFAQPTATPNWAATQMAATAGGATNGNTGASTAEVDNIFYHTVQAQENLFRIGLLYNVPWPLIAAANEITDESELEIGDRIVIPFLNSDGTEQTADIPAQPTSTNTTTDAPVPPAATEQLTYVVQQGDTLYSISRSFGLTTEAVATANGIINPEVIEVGMVLIIPVPNVELPDAPEQYVVVAGDTLYQIGMRFGVSWREIATINNIASPFNIEIGQTLVIP